MANKKLKKHTLLLNTGDYNRLAELWPNLAPAIVIRTIVSEAIAKREKELEDDAGTIKLPRSITNKF